MGLVKKLMDRLFLVKVWLNQARIWALNLLIRGYTEKSLAKRKGFCDYKKCKAICCGPCTHLNSDYSCKVYSHRPNWCKTKFPIDEFELKFFKLEKHCSFSWDKKNKKS